MNTKEIINSLPFKISSELHKDIDIAYTLSDKLHIIRNWIQSNQTINHKKRLEWHQPILKISKKHKLLQNEATSYSNIIKIYDRLGEFKKSLKTIEISQKIWMKLCSKDKKYYHDLIISYCDKAVTLRLQNKLDLALKALYKGYEIMKINNINSKKTLIVLYMDLGVVYEKILDYPAALNLFNETLNLIKKSKNSNNFFENQVLCHINIGNVHKLSNDLDLASKEFEKAIDLLVSNDKINQHLIIANINLGQTLVELKKYKKALLVYNNGLKVCIQIGSDMDLGFIYTVIAETYFKMNDKTKFDSFINKGKKLVKKSSYPNDLVYLNNVLHIDHTSKNQFDKGISYLLESVKICEKYKMDQHLLRTYTALSNAYKNINDTKNALKYSQNYINHRNLVDSKLYKLFLNEKQQSLNRMQEEINIIKAREEKKALAIELKFKKRELISKKLHSVSNRDFLMNVYKSLKKDSNLEKPVEKILKKFQDEIELSTSWKEYLDTYEQIHPDFVSSLNKLSCDLSSTEIRVCSLIHLGLDNYEISKLMFISKRSVEQHRYRIKKKLNIDQNLNDFILSLS